MADRYGLPASKARVSFVTAPDGRVNVIFWGKRGERPAMSQTTFASKATASKRLTEVFGTDWREI